VKLYYTGVTLLGNSYLWRDEVYKLNINNQYYDVDVSSDTPLLWVLRDHLQLHGTKYGCGVGECGSCMVHVDGKAENSCLLLASSLVGRKIITIEGISKGSKLHPVQLAWLENNVPECGYCQSGQIMKAIEILARGEILSSQEIADEMSAVLCRCGTYTRILQAVLHAQTKFHGESRND